MVLSLGNGAVPVPGLMAVFVFMTVDVDRVPRKRFG